MKPIPPLPSPDIPGEINYDEAAVPPYEIPELLGLPGLPPGDFPADFDESRIGTRLGYVRRGGLHGPSAYDWSWILGFAERAF